MMAMMVIITKPPTGRISTSRNNSSSSSSNKEEEEVVFTRENRLGSAQHATRATPLRSGEAEAHKWMFERTTHADTFSTHLLNPKHMIRVKKTNVAGSGGQVVSSAPQASTLGTWLRVWLMTFAGVLLLCRVQAA